jgi:hypothetical protein
MTEKRDIMKNKERKFKKSQIQNQVFIYILAVMIMGGVLLMGYKAIQSFIDNSNLSLLETFEQDLKSRINSVSQQYGQKMTTEFIVPKKYTEICFLDRISQHDIPDTHDYPIIDDIYQDNIKVNAFLIDRFAEKFFYVPNLVVLVENEEGFICKEIKYGRFEMNIQGVSGRKASVSFNED